MSDLRESGSLEQDADIVMLMFRPDYYDPQTSQAKQRSLSPNRHGQVGNVTLISARSTQFGNYSGSDESFQMTMIQYLHLFSIKLRISTLIE